MIDLGDLAMRNSLVTRTKFEKKNKGLSLWLMVKVVPSIRFSLLKFPKEQESIYEQLK